MGVEIQTVHPAGVAAPGAPGTAAAVGGAGRLAPGTAFGRGALATNGAPLRGRVSLSAGRTLPDAHLADYQWDVTPRAAWGGELGITDDAWSGGVALRTWGTTQAVDARAEGPVAVRLTSVQPRLERRVLSAGGTTLAARAGFGALRVGYAPARVTLATGGAPVEVRFLPSWTWLATAGLSLDRPLAAGLAVGLGVERSLYPLDTTHRRGDTFLERREYFGGWTVDGRLTWRGGAF